MSEELKNILVASEDVMRAPNAGIIEHDLNALEEREAIRRDHIENNRDAHLLAEIEKTQAEIPMHPYSMQEFQSARSITEA